MVLLASEVKVGLSLVHIAGKQFNDEVLELLSPLHVVQDLANRRQVRVLILQESSALQLLCLLLSRQLLESALELWRDMDVIVGPDEVPLSSFDEVGFQVDKHDE